MPRFFVDPKEIHPSFMVLTGENAAHARVLRLKDGDEVTVCDGEGTDYLCTVSDVQKDQISLVVHSSDPSHAEASVKVRIYMALAKGDKFEHVIQKATELGAYEIICFPSARCVSRPDDKSLGKKLDRWQKIAASAAEQSRRGLIPQVRSVSSYAAALRDAATADLAVCFYENEEKLTFRAAIEEKSFQSVSILTGPEGGFELSEIREAQEAGLKICTLGSRILRCETAPLCALSAVMYAVGEF